MDARVWRSRVWSGSSGFPIFGYPESPSGALLFRSPTFPRCQRHRRGNAECRSRTSVRGGRCVFNGTEKRFPGFAHAMFSTSGRSGGRLSERFSRRGMCTVIRWVPCEEVSTVSFCSVPVFFGIHLARISLTVFSDSPKASPAYLAKTGCRRASPRS